MAPAPSAGGHPRRAPRVAGHVACAIALGAVVAAAAAADATPRPAHLDAAVRQADALRGTPCTGDNGCGGYAVFPPLWCRAGEGADTPTCREYVGEDEACDAVGVLCDETTRFGGQSLSCVNGICSTFVTGVTRGDRCPVGQSPSPCVAGHNCRFVDSVGGGGDSRCVSVGAAGTVCGGPLAICAPGTECIDGETGEACPLTRKVGTPPLEKEERFLFPACTNTTTAAGGTCRAAATPTVGTPCNDLGERDDVCQRSGDAALICSRVAFRSSQGDLRCVKRTAPGAPCALSGASGPGVCSEQPRDVDEQLCINGTCVTYTFPGPLVSSLGNECNFRDGCDGADGGVVCRFWEGQANGVCWRERVPAGGACGVAAFGICNEDAGLTCADEVCVAATAAAQGAPCDNRLDVSCDQAAVGNRSGRTICRQSGPTGGGDGGTRCLFSCAGGDACAGEFDLCSDGRVIDGVCVMGALKGDPCDHPRADCRPFEGLYCRPIDGDGGGSGTSVRVVDGVCAVKAAAGSACDATTGDQCADGLACVDGTCGQRVVGLGDACTSDADCRNTEDGQTTGCWRGRGAAGKTCRAWRGPYESCAGADSKCWTPALFCTEKGDDSVCVNAEGRGDLGAYCRLDGSDCTAADDLFCAASPFTAAPVCKRYVGDGERCDPGLGTDLRLCNAADGLVCRYNGRFSGRPVGYFCQAPAADDQRR